MEYSTSDLRHSVWTR